jgi:hypothetical protein
LKITDGFISKNPVYLIWRYDGIIRRKNVSFHVGGGRAGGKNEQRKNESKYFEIFHKIGFKFGNEIPENASYK